MAATLDHMTETRQDDVLSDGHPVDYYLHEQYKKPREKKGLMALYYAVRPLMPRPLQLALRRVYARRQAKAAFPAWPIEPILVNRANNEMKARIEQSTAGRIPLINFWPGSYRAAVILTHDVEWAHGAENIGRVRELERKYGVVSSWNFVPERYVFDKRIFDRLLAEGCEIGLHGLYHDGRDFGSRQLFLERLPKMNAYLEGWGAVGFRSPATHRNPDWMPELAAEYDSSFPDTDPFEPQSGGCCSIFPFFLKDMVELPITLPQDHTMFEILRLKNIDIWKEKAAWIIRNHGLVNIIVHPDYMLTDEALSHYEAFLAFITAQPNLWMALPKDVARWWRERAESQIMAFEGIEPVVRGPAADRAAIAWATLNNGNVVYNI